MTLAFNDLQRITSEATPRDQRLIAMRSFARELEWTPSYEFEASFGIRAAENHLVVEHGLDTSAVITFLRAPYRSADLARADLRSLLAISYNNLVEWHFFVSQSDIRQVNNLVRSDGNGEADRVFSLTQDTAPHRLSANEIQNLRTSRSFQDTTASCDEALMDVITRWKRLLKADYPRLTNESLSTLFNAIIFVRGCEDRFFEKPHRIGRPLLKVLERDGSETVSLPALLSEAMSEASVNRPLGDFVNLTLLAELSAVDRATASNLIRDFYVTRDSLYDFNFALMSKHALSRIYERYVSLFREDIESDAQLGFFGSLPNIKNSNRGSVYTPQFIAGFFSRYIKENTTPRTFRTLQYIDPACGSGIFLRTLLELQSSPLEPGVTADTIKLAFSRAHGVDRDANAVLATKLSLSLLHLVATGALPAELPIRVSDAIYDAIQGTIPENTYDAVVTNPPYVKLDHLSEEDREQYLQFLGEDFKGRTDAYLAFVKLSLNALARDGIACMVLPQVFLVAQNAASLRAVISRDFDVRCLVDLSAVNVFENVGAYSILLIVQRRGDLGAVRSDASLAQVTDFVGPALQACLDGRSIDNPYYRVFWLPQSFFERTEWTIVPPAFLAIEQKLAKLPKISHYLDVSQGIVTGLDAVFIRALDEIPRKERDIYIDFLPDREIQRYALPGKVRKAFFYPYKNGALLSEEELRDRYSETWGYLKENRARLQDRGPVKRGTTPWWRPERPRPPNVLRRAKIVTPHLVFTPRFALDVNAQFSVSHSPFLSAKEGEMDLGLLRVFLGILNSSVGAWYLKTFAPTYARGYSRVEAKTLRDMPAPDLSSAAPKSIIRLASLVETAESRVGSAAIDQEIDELVADLYGLSVEERSLIIGRSGSD